jgi:hypothetical protein
MAGWLTVKVEGDSIEALEGGGEWYTVRRFNFLRSGELDLYELLFFDLYGMTPLMDIGEPFCVRCTGVDWIIEDGFWDIDYGYMEPDAIIEVETCKIVECNEDS